MEEEILKLYEKIKDQLSEEQFQAEMEEILEINNDVPFYEEINAAQEVLKNHGINVLTKVEDVETSQEVPFEINIDNDDEESSPEGGADEEVTITMTDEIQEIYDKVKDKISEEDFLDRVLHFKKENSHALFMDDVAFANMAAGELEDEEVPNLNIIGTMSNRQARKRRQRRHNFRQGNFNLKSKVIQNQKRWRR